MKVFFILFIVYLIIQRTMEWIISNRNEKWMMQKGGIVYGGNRYKVFVYLYCSFFFLLLIEVTYNKFVFPKFNLFLVILYLITQLGRIWCIKTLGKFWNKKEAILPKITFIRKGLYKYFKRPIDLMTGIEFILIPFIFGAYITVTLFPLCYTIILIILTLLEEGIIKSNIKEG